MQCKSDDFEGTDQHRQRLAVDDFQRADEDGAIQPLVRAARRFEFQTRSQIGCRRGHADAAIADTDQTAVVTGNLGASPALAGALAGGPAVGAAVLLFSQIFKEPLKGITRGYYRITGPWDDPVVERVDAAAAKAEVSGD